MLPNDNIRHYTKKDIQEIFSISLSKIDKAMKTKELSFIKIGKRCVRISERDLQRWIKRNEATSPSII